MAQVTKLQDQVKERDLEVAELKMQVEKSQQKSDRFDTKSVDNEKRVRTSSLHIGLKPGSYFAKNSWRQLKFAQLLRNIRCEKQSCDINICFAGSINRA